MNDYRITCRSSQSAMFCKKGVLRNFVKLTGKHLCQSLFFGKVAGLFLQNTSGAVSVLGCSTSFIVNRKTIKISMKGQP